MRPTSSARPRSPRRTLGSPAAGEIPAWSRSPASGTGRIRRAVRAACSVALLASVISAYPPPVLAAAPLLSSDDGALFRKALVAMDRTKWKARPRPDPRSQDPLLHTIAKWRWLSADDGLFTWQQVRDFHTGHANWPFAKRRQALAERRMPVNLPDRTSGIGLSDFLRSPAPGRCVYAEALAAAGVDVDVAAEARAAWRTGGFQSAEARSFLQRYGRHLSEEDHAARLDRLIWERQWERRSRSFGAYRPISGAWARHGSDSAGDPMAWTPLSRESRRH